MPDSSLRRADELLTELVEQVETARALPMSSSCVLPRERMLDLLDEVREVLPPEIQHARRVITARDTLLHDAYAEATAIREGAAAEAAATTEAATAEAAATTEAATAEALHLVRDAEARAHQIVKQAHAEHAALIAATSVHQAANAAAAELRREAELLYRQLRQEAEQYALQTRADADRYAARMAADSEAYADRTLYELAATLQHAAATAEQGRVALARRRAGHAIPDAGAHEADPTPAPDEAREAEDGVAAGDADGHDELVEQRVPA